MAPVQLLRMAVLIFACAGLSNAARAALLTTKANSDFSASPVTIAFGGTAASYVFSLLNPGPDDPDPAGVSTGGTALVASYGPPFYDPPHPTSYIGAGLIGDDMLAIYLAYATPAVIPFSRWDSFIGLKLTLLDGVHFGYAELLGAILVSYGYETIAGQPVVIGAEPAVPEPISLSLLASGVTGLAVFRRRMRRV
ncbi:MAG: hypothetical protein JWM77_413 [Rhodospirillales bacterium]|nr:hypothetical protein [Rhodospirillales bacterium]